MRISTVGRAVPVLLLGMSLVGIDAFAMPPQANAHAQAAQEARSSNPSGSPEAGRANGQAHLADAQLKACQNRENAINNIMARIVDRGTKQINVFDTIAVRVEDFYAKQGKTVSNYGALVTAADAAKTKAQADLAAVKTDATFSCVSPDPKATITAFQSTLRLEIADLKAYKTAVRNLIVAVKSVDGASASQSPEPSESPKASPSTQASVSPSTSPQENQ